MAEISDLDEISGELPSEDEIRAIIRRLNITIYNIVNSNGTYSGVDYEEHGPMGFRITPSTTLTELRELLKMYNEMLKDPMYCDDVDYVLTQFDNPGL